jgi:eukaryotic-like serine/threonine-protein kinase
MQLIEGQPIHQCDFDISKRIALLRNAAEGIHAAHRAGLLHLDLKPANVLVQIKEDGNTSVLVTDFGIATSSGVEVAPQSLGSPPFCAPEQLNRSVEALDHRTDVYGLGATLYALLTRKQPFEADSLTDLLDRIQREDPIPLRKQAPNLSADLEAIVSKAMAKSPASRYPSALSFADDLQRYLDGAPVAARDISHFAKMLKWTHRNPLIAASAGIAIASLLGLGGWAWVTHQRSLHRQALAQAFSEDVRNLELNLRTMRMLPPQDNRPFKVALRKRMARIEASLPEMREMASAGYFALGLGHRALGEWEPSAMHFKKAWDLGFQTPESAEATGIALGIHTGQRSVEIEKLPEPERTQKLSELQQNFGAPGVEILKAFEGRPGASPYARAMSAFHRKAWDEVIQGCLETLKTHPWRVEVWRMVVVQADAHPELQERFGLKLDGDGYSNAVRQLERTGQGDVISQSALGKHWELLAEKAPEASVARMRFLSRALAAHQNARIIEPEHEYYFRTPLEFCEQAATSLDKAHADQWKREAKGILEEGAKEPKLREIAKTWPWKLKD